MKIIRGGLLFVGVILLFLSLLLGNIFFVLSSSLDYNVVSQNLSFSVNEILENNYDLSNYLEKNYTFLVEYCSPHETYLYNYSLIYTNVSCSSVLLGINDTKNFIQTKNPSISPLVIASINSDLINIYPSIKDYCSPHEFYPSGISRMNFSCNSILLGKEELRNSIIKTFVDEIYYKDYKCTFWQCISKTGSTFFLVSEKALDYWKSKFYLFLVFSIILLGLIYFLVDEKLSLFFILGGSLIVSSLPLIKIESFLLILLKPFIKGLDYFDYLDSSTVISVLSIFFSRAGVVFKFVFILGILLIFSGIILKFWSFFTGRTNQMFSKKDIEEIVKEEVKNSKGKSK